MPEPALTPSERTLLTTAVSQITAAQAAAIAATGRFRQARSGRDAEFQALGLAGPTLAMARSAGTKADVDEYFGPLGAGWEFRIVLVRDGVTWDRRIQSGPETWRERAWREAVTLAQ